MQTNSAAIDLRREPSDAFITAVRKKYPVEPEIDHILNRKMTSRAKGGGYTPISLEALRQGIEALIRSSSPTVLFGDLSGDGNAAAVVVLDPVAEAEAIQGVD